MARKLRNVEKRRAATVAEVLDAVSKDAVTGLFVKRSVSAVVAHEAIKQLIALMGERAVYDPRIVPIVQHRDAARAAGAPTTRLRAPREIGDVIKYQTKARGKSRWTQPLPLATLGDPEEVDVAFGPDRIIIARRGELTAAELAAVRGPPKSQEAVLAELEAAQKPTGTA